MIGASVTDRDPSAQLLLGRVLRPERPAALAAEYPLVFDGRFPGRVIAVEEQGLVRSGCGVLARDLLIDGARLRVGLIGSVATDVAWRGRGLAQRALDQAEEWLAAEGCAAALLWADDPAFYGRRGYAALGRELDALVPASALAALGQDPGVRSYVREDAAAVHGWYTRHGTRVDRSAEETAALLACPGMETLVLQREREVVAYACLGRGADFAGTVHEWGGEADDVLALLGEHARRARARNHHGPIAVIAPPEAARLVERLAALDARISTGVLALGKVLLPEPLCALIRRFASPWQAEWDPQALPGSRAGVVLRGPRGGSEITAEQLLATLFAARGDRSHVRELEAALGAPAPRLPLAPFLWGLDSI